MLMEDQNYQNTGYPENSKSLYLAIGVIINIASTGFSVSVAYFG